MKRKHLLVVLLILSLLFNIYSIAIQSEKKERADEKFRMCIDKADYYFGADYDKMDEETKTYYFSNLSSNLNAASEILPFTSYAKVPNKEGSMNAISKLYLITTSGNKTTNDKLKAFAKKNQDIFKYLQFISYEPKNKDNWDKLLKIEDDMDY